jgi:hypothetical protein
VIRDAGGRRVGAVRGAEGIIDVDIGERGKRLRELGVVLFFARLEPEVFQQQDLAVPKRIRGPVTAFESLTGWPTSSSSRLATGAIEYFGLRCPFGRPRWLARMIFAPCSRSQEIVGSADVMRVSSVIVSPSSGTLKSTRTKIRFPLTGAVVTERGMAMADSLPPCRTGRLDSSRPVFCLS